MDARSMDSSSGPSNATQGQSSRYESSASNPNGNTATEPDEEYDYTDDVDVEMLKPTPKLPDEAPKLPDSFLALDAGEPASLSDTLDTVFFSNAGEGETSRVGKRASNVLKLAAEHAELQAKLREMTERLEAAERRRAALEARQSGAANAPAAAPPPSSFRSLPSTPAPAPSIASAMRPSGEYHYNQRPTGLQSEQPTARSSAGRI